ncbi:MAG TPA: hypothetical protein VKY74_22100, partial [Chloroflexia bacterium]|nr:hypothetical protein [Chloroflexia bacterium]
MADNPQMPAALLDLEARVRGIGKLIADKGTPLPQPPATLITYQIKDSFPLNYPVRAEMKIDTQGDVSDYYGQLQTRLTPAELQDLIDLFHTSGFFNASRDQYTLRQRYGPGIRHNWTVGLVYSAPHTLPFIIYLEGGTQLPAGLQALVARLASIQARVTIPNP